jgi:hypothetical protein
MITKPKVLDDWEKAGPPRVCFNCDFNVNHKCTQFDAVPPDDFQQTPGACDRWELTIPF